jgi:molybdopterin converting factor small subunit
MAIIIVNSFIRDALGETTAELSGDACIELPATSMRELLTMLEARYPGCRQALAKAAVAIDGDIYTHALTETLTDDTELVFIPAIEGG